MPEVDSKHEKSFDNKKFLIIMIALITTILIDTSVVRINDLIDKNFISLQIKLMLFAVNSSSCLLLQFVIIRYVSSSFKKHQLNNRLRVKAFYIVSYASLCVLASLVGFLILQQLYNNYYDTWVSISVILISYGISGAFIIWLSILFFSWYRSNHSFIILLYFISMSVIAFNLIMTTALTCVKVSARPSQIGEYVGTSGDVSGGRYPLLNDIFKVSSFLSFFSIWITTAILMSSYRDKLINSIVYWIILSIPVAYFLITYFYQFILGNILTSYLEADPVTVSIVLGTFLSLSKPIGGLIFGVAFWNISKIISYERNIKTAMIIAGWGILLIFIANQAASQIVGPYPPFGLATVTGLNVAGYLMLLGIYNSATLVSVNKDLRRFIHKHALESRLLGLLGQAEMQTEIQKTVKKIAADENSLVMKTEQPVELDEMELRKYVGLVIKEVKKEHQP